MKSLYEQDIPIIYLVDIINEKVRCDIEDFSYLRNKYSNGESLRSLSSEIGKSRAFVKARLFSIGIQDFNVRKLSLEHKQLDLILKKREIGMSYQKIAEYLNENQELTPSGSGKWHAKTIRDHCLRN